MTDQSKQFLADLINNMSPSGYEAPVAKVWKAEAEPFASRVWTDTHGNSHAIVNPGGSPVVMLAGHYDEISFLISHIDDEGFLWFQPMGSADCAGTARSDSHKERGVTRCDRKNGDSYAEPRTAQTAG
ncbi:hypothetical protein P4E94_07325 [Pontiellaceae bacterium B12219]|nr:hypothetical protein [Pontiellaceae bacterium B12219]